MIPLAILGVGNALRGDDGAGLELVRRLRVRLGPTAPARAVAADPVALAAAWSGAERAVVVDAVDAGRAAGETLTLDAGREPLAAELGSVSSHGLGLGAAIEIARALGTLPPALTVCGIQGGTWSGSALSLPVERAVERRARSLLADLDAAGIRRTIDPGLPLIDLHRHLDGNVRLETILELARAHGVALPADTVEGLRPHAQVIEPVPGVMAFIARFRWAMAAVADLAAAHRVAHENVEDARREGLDYVELRFSPWFMAEAHGLEPHAVVEAVVDGVRAGAREFGVRVGLLGVLSRTYGPEIAARELDAILARRDAFAGVDLAGDEVAWPGEHFVEHFARARAAGLEVTVHAGEAAGPESVWQALRGLGARRLGHAVHAIEDPELLAFLARESVAIECSLTSNVQTGTVAGYAAHPIGEFLARGLLATINTDDPGVSAIDLPHEYRIAAPAAGLDTYEIRRAQANALEAAFLDSGERRALAREVAGAG